MNDTEIQDFIDSCRKDGISRNKATMALTKIMYSFGMNGPAIVKALFPFKDQINTLPLN